MSTGIQNSERAPRLPDAEIRILVLAPIGRDGPLAIKALLREGIAAFLCQNQMELCREIERGAAGALLTSEALIEESGDHLAALLHRQPAWSDLPLLLLVSESERVLLEEMARPLGNVTVLERPLSLSSLLSAVRATLRARYRQYQLRNLLQQTEQGRKEAEQQQAQIEALNERLQRTMRETHHRVKNNLQIVASLVDMQITEGEPTVPIEEMIRLRTHVRMLAAVHDLLTQQAREDPQAHSLSAEELLLRLLPLIRQTAPQCDFRYSAEDAQLSARQGTSLAVVANELLSNAIKYGHGIITLRFWIEDEQALLEVCDNGPGFPPSFDVRTAAHTGLDLVENLIRWDLGGTVRYFNRPTGGGCVTVTMPFLARTPSPPSPARGEGENLR
ncbi:MAG TPA: sensor histidine kinase [Chthonomonadaceae bacterium]|nr:sensor histidine kinase [Chthonomonadaceae bacterium]